MRFAVIGCGVIAATHAEAIQQIPDAELVACCDTSVERALGFAQKYRISGPHVHLSMSSLLQDELVDAVTICTPSGTHALIASECLWSGKPALVEKPMDVNLEAIELLIAAEASTGVTLGVVSQHRFDEASLYCHELIKEGHLGTPLICEAQIKWYRSQEYYDSGVWRGTWELDGGGALMNQGIHTVDLMRWMMGPVHSVYSVSRTLAHKGIEVEDVLCATLTFESGAIGNIVASTAAYPGFPATLSIHGTTGSFVLSGDVLTSLELMENDIPDSSSSTIVASGTTGHAVQVAQGGTKLAELKKGYTVDPTSTSWGDAHKAQIEDFIASVRNGTRPQVSGQEGREALEIVLAAYESSRSGKVVVLS